MVIKGACGAFCSELISKVYVKHLQQIAVNHGMYGPQIRGLAFATAAVHLNTLNDYHV
jgi:hypothetical protein